MYDNCDKLGLHVSTGGGLPMLRTPLLSTVVSKYLRTVQPYKRSQASRGSDRSRLVYWRDGPLGALPVTEVKASDIVECRDALKASGLSGATCNRYLAALSHVYSVALRDWELVDRHPVRQVRRYRESRGRVRYLSDEERVRLFLECRFSRNRHLYAAVVLSLCTGCRQGELIGLPWRNVWLSRRTVLFGETKNDQPRTVPLATPAIEVLEALPRRTVLVFPGSFRTAWENARDRAGLVDFRWHDLRHSCASYLAMSGASLADIAEVLGHKTLEMTKRYTHLSPPHTRRVMDKMAGQVFGGTPS